SFATISISPNLQRKFVVRMVSFCCCNQRAALISAYCPRRCIGETACQAGGKAAFAFVALPRRDLAACFRARWAMVNNGRSEKGLSMGYSIMRLTKQVYRI